jgi:hypothetical protein
MTRGRARNAGLVPTDLHVEYYRQRASAGLVLTEALWISREAIGFINLLPGRPSGIHRLSPRHVIFGGGLR